MQLWVAACRRHVFFGFSKLNGKNSSLNCSILGTSSQWDDLGIDFICWNSFCLNNLDFFLALSLALLSRALSLSRSLICLFVCLQWRYRYQNKILWFLKARGTKIEPFRAKQLNKYRNIKPTMQVAIMCRYGREKTTANLTRNKVSDL